jgi:hypothetical protein
VSAVALSLGTADEGWLWAATPVNLGLSILLFALGKTCDAPAHRRDRQPNP